MKPTLALPRSRGKALTKSSATDERRGPSSWPSHQRKGVRRDLARAIIDASGTWTTPNPLGASGLPAVGEAEFADRIAYGIPDILGRDRHIYAGRKTLVVGSGHSAANALLELAQLAEIDPRTSFLWATRSADLARIFSGGDADQLPARGELGANVRALVDNGRVTLLTGFAVVGAP